MRLLHVPRINLDDCTQYTFSVKCVAEILHDEIIFINLMMNRFISFKRIVKTFGDRSFAIS